MDLSCERLLARKIWEKPCRNAGGSVGFFAAKVRASSKFGSPQKTAASVMRNETLHHSD